MDYFPTLQDNGVIFVSLRGGRDKDEATHFRVENGILELSNAGRTVLSHRVQADPLPPEFWTNETDGPRVLAWNNDVAVNRHRTTREDRPIYGFSNQQLYELFQSELRNVRFVKEFVTDSIKPSGKSTSRHSAVDCNVKIWESRNSFARSITLPFTSRGEIVHEVLYCAWLDLRRGEGKQSNVMHITFKVNRARGNSHSHSRSPSFGNGISKLAKLKHFGRSGTWSKKNDVAVESPAPATPALEYAERAPVELSTQLSEVVITFKDSMACLLFDEEVRPFLQPMRNPHVFVNPPSQTTPPSEYDNEQVPSPVTSQGGRRARSASSVSPTARPVAVHSTPPTTQPPSTSPRQGQKTPSEPDWLLPSPVIPAGPTVGTGLGVSFETPATTSPPSINLPPHTPSIRAHTPEAIEPYRPPPSPSLTAQQQQEERTRFCMRQTDIAPIAKSARRRAQSNKDFYDLPLSAKDEIRLLHIMAGRDGELELRLEGKSLAQAAGTYEALSYSWGTGTDLIGVTLENGRRRDKKFQVSFHLDQALRRLRLVGEERIVWIDAICINQADVKEMNHQVPLMGEIYRRAKRTIIWIAEFEKTTKVPTCIRNFPAEDDDEDSRTLCARFDGTALEHGDLDTQLKSLLQDFHKRLEAAGSGDAWYLRLWCVQEFHFSQKLPSVYLGQHAIGWHHFATLFKKVIGEYGPMSLFEQLRNQERRTMHGLCATTGAFKVSDPRDRIYSLLNMTDFHPAKVKPDYAKSILEVLEEVVHYLIQESQTVDVLLDKRCDRSFGDGYGIGVLPSYMPDLTKLQSSHMSEGIDKYYTGNKKAPDVELCIDDEHDDEHALYPGAIIPRVLYMKAIKFDTIKYFTTVDDIPQHETSPSKALIYNSLAKPGELIMKILEALHFKWEASMMKWELDRTPKVGRLILEFLFEEQRNHLQELDRCNESLGTNLKALFTTQAEADKRYVREEDELEGDRNLSDDVDYISEHWTQRIKYISDESKGRLDVAKMLDQELDLWREALSYDNSVCRDFRAATDFENLFCYARRTHNKYYFSAQDYHQPMRRNVLDAKTMQEIQELETEFGRDGRFELHEYSDKARQRDFFSTAGGFVGLGPTGMRQGDVLVVPYSASRPFVLRPCHGKDGYTLIGEAVLPGVMHGQWLSTHEKYAQYYKLR